ncbi:hypothetical protein ACQQ2Q_20010 [Agrobacterium sp. ES01]|uniref:hypothetical protein n=1 Tax=Agrobacterium sp. ES01 TaxID=3420714 RepID=UPI003D12560F
MNPTFLLWLAGAMTVFLGAATATRSYLDSSRWTILVFALVLYCIGNLMMVRLMREGGMGLAISASSVGQLVLINVIAVAMFGERLSNIQMAGVGLGVVAMVLMLYPTAERIAP